MTLQELDRLLDRLTVFEALEDDPVFDSFRKMLWHASEHLDDAFGLYSGFCADLYQIGHTDDWTAYLTELVMMQENVCTYFAAADKPVPNHIEQAARLDLRALSAAAAVTPDQVQTAFDGSSEQMPLWNASSVDFETLFFARLKEINKHGYGIFARYRMFHMELSEQSENGFELVPVPNPDAVSVSDLIGYELQRNQVIENTRTLLNGLTASNVLLYGDAGTGKSATVKAVANAYADQGLRLIELTKDELHLLPKLLDRLSTNPLKFILFIDDLSFQDNDDDFSALKAVLEGSISARSHNTVIYATSNRRHIVRETFSQRAGDDIHRNDTMQETISLSERFGIRILYDKPNKQLYLDIVNGLAGQYGLQMDADELALEAERFALRRSGRSARAARQLIEQLCAAELTKNKE